MVTLNVISASGETVGTVDVDPAKIAPKITRQLMHDALVMYLANQRQGSNKTKGRSEVSGTTKKMYRQKGTGHARMGSKRSPIRVGGGHAKSRQPRSYYYRLPRKAVQAATRMAIASKLNSGAVVVFDNMSFDAPKTKNLRQMFKAAGIDGQTATIATAEIDRNTYLSGRNLPGVTVSPISDLNTLSVLRPRKLVLSRSALDALLSHYTHPSQQTETEQAS